MIRTSKSEIHDIGPDYQKVPREEALAYQWDIIQEWDKPSEV